MGKMISQKVVQEEVPSTLAASRTSSGMDCKLASRTSITNGVHSQATINVTLSRGKEENQGTAGKPTACNPQSITPKLGLNNRFFQMSAITDGVTRNGTVARPRNTFFPRKERFNSKARMVPAHSARAVAPKTSSMVCPIMGQKFGSPKNVVR